MVRTWCFLLTALSLSVSHGARHGIREGRRLQLRSSPESLEELELDRAKAVKKEAEQVIFEGTKERCGNSNEELSEDVQMLCKQTEPSSLLAVLFEKLQNKSQDVGLWLCSAAESTIDTEWKTHYSEHLSCDEAATSTIGAMLSLDKENATLATRLAAVAEFTLWTTKFALIVATPFIPLPFGFLARKLLDVVIGQLTGNAEEELGSLEKRMEEISHRAAQRLQIDEAFRIGSAHARAANDQIKDMAMIDHLWSSSMTAMSDGGANKDNALLWSTLQKVTSFNRWAIIEHDLAMCIEVLIPQDSLEIIDRAIFAKLMKVHFEMYVLVLSHMSAAVDANQNVEDMKVELSKKAIRMASLTLPQLVLLSTAVEPGQDLKSVRTMFDSDLLSANGSHREVQGCNFLQEEANYEFEFLAACVWLPFLRKSDAWATPLPAPRLLSNRQKDTDRPDPSIFEYWHAIGAPQDFASMPHDPPQIEMESAELRISCPVGSFLSSVEYAFTKPAGSWGGKQHFLKGVCSNSHTVETAANSQFSTSGLCTDVAALFSDHVVAVMTGLVFSRPSNDAAKIKHSTCKLAYLWSSDGPYHIPGSSLMDSQDIFCENDCDARSLIASGAYAYILRPAEQGGEIDVWKSHHLDYDDRLQWIKAIQGPYTRVELASKVSSITSVTLARNYMVFGLSNGQVSWTSIEFEYSYMPMISVGELAGKPISSLVARGSFIFAASYQAMLVYMISMMPRPVALSKKFLVLPRKDSKRKKDGVLGLTVVGSHMYIASQQHIHRISIETQEAAYAYHKQGLTAAFAGIQDGFLYMSWLTAKTVLDNYKEKEELAKIPLHFRNSADMVKVMPVGERSWDAVVPVVVSPDHAYAARTHGAVELDLQKGSAKEDSALELCSTCYIKSIALWRGRVYQAISRIRVVMTKPAAPLHPETMRYMEEMGFRQSPLA